VAKFLFNINERKKGGFPGKERYSLRGVLDISWKISFINPPEGQGQVVRFAYLFIDGKNIDAKISKSSIWVNNKIAPIVPLYAPHPLRTPFPLRKRYLQFWEKSNWSKNPDRVCGKEGKEKSRLEGLCFFLLSFRWGSLYNPIKENRGPREPVGAGKFGGNSHLFFSRKFSKSRCK
jgi:hypothetical protein